MARDVLQTIKDLIVAGGYTETVYKGPWKSQCDDRAISLTPSGLGGANEPFFNGTDEVEKQKLIQVRIRGERGDHKQVEADARLVEDALVNESPSGTLSVDIVSGPLYIAQDDEDRYEYSINARVWLIE